MGGLRDVLCRGLAELAELKLAFFVAHVHAIEGQRVEMHIEPERAVSSLHKGERAYLGVAYRTQRELSFRATTQRALQRIGERAKNIGTKSSVIASWSLGDDAR